MTQLGHVSPCRKHRRGGIESQASTARLRAGLCHWAVSVTGMGRKRCADHRAPAAKTRPAVTRAEVRRNQEQICLQVMRFCGYTFTGTFKALIIEIPTGKSNCNQRSETLEYHFPNEIIIPVTKVLTEKGF